MTGPKSRVEFLLEQALDETRNGIDAIPTAHAALTALRMEVGEVAPDELDEVVRDCTCPPGLLERGGFRGGCPVHAS